MTNTRSALLSCVSALALVLLNSTERRLYAQGTEEYNRAIPKRDATGSVRRVAAANAGAAIRFVDTGVSRAAVRVANSKQALVALQRNPAVVSIVPHCRFVYQHGDAINGNPNKGGGGGQQGQTIPAGVVRVG